MNATASFRRKLQGCDNHLKAVKPGHAAITQSRSTTNQHGGPTTCPQLALQRLDKCAPPAVTHADDESIRAKLTPPRPRNTTMSTAPITTWPRPCRSIRRYHRGLTYTVGCVPPTLYIFRSDGSLLQRSPMAALPCSSISLGQYRSSSAAQPTAFPYRYGCPTPTRASRRWST